MNASEREEILWRHIQDLPYFRGMLRAVEDSFYQELELPRPVLDVGCGDGHFASVAFREPLEVGIDPWLEPLREAHARKAYGGVLQADGGKLPFATGHFASAVSNSVLEHIPHVEQVLTEVARVVRPGGLFVFCVPNQRFPENLLGTSLFRSLGWRSASAAYARMFNQVSRHAHTDSQAVWKERLSSVGFEVERCWDYFSPAGLRALEAGHLFGLPSLFVRRFTGRWLLLRSRANLSLPYAITHRYVQNPVDDRGAYTFYITRRTAV
jgi:SAM-dependent methyltransferase